ncbi:hypothetical protein [Microbacterium sp. T2.11-28]|uniref:hypothetical protein n=1 Tax=unclassified Microbacterium TaxID=2609290 RepID=UPI0025406B36|nr:hypothetical protein [Microbacterium sp. T2.11-28]
MIIAAVGLALAVVLGIASRDVVWAIGLATLSIAWGVYAVVRRRRDSARPPRPPEPPEEGG